MLVLIEMDISGLYLVILRILLRAIVTNRKNFKFPVKKTGNPSSKYIKVPLYREKTVALKTHKTGINRPVDNTGET